MNGNVGFDTNIFIYHFHDNPEFSDETDKLFKKLEKGSIRGVTSIITLTEILAYKISDVEVKRLKILFHELPNLKTFNVTENIALVAARIRRSYGFRLPDSIQLATALEGKANFFITNDARLKKFKEIKVLLLHSTQALLT